MDRHVRPSPLYDVQARAGARFTAWQGALWAGDFGDPIAEHHAVRSAVGVWDVSPLHVWEVRGAGAMDAIGHAFTNDLAGAGPGDIRYGLLCADDGTIVNDATVFAFGPHHAWVVTSMGSDVDHLREHAAGPAVSIAARERVVALQVQGPDSARLLASLGAPVDDLAFFRFRPGPHAVGGAPCVLARIGFSGELGYELFCPAAEGERLWSAVVDAGARPYGFAAVQTLRIEAGLALLGEDFLTRCSRPFDVSLDRFVALGSHAFTGDEALARLADAPPRRLVTVIVEGDRVPAPGAVVWGGSGPVGRVTSACLSPSYGAVVALAGVETAVAVPRRRLLVQVGGDHVPATVQAGPVHDPRGLRRRGDPGAAALSGARRVAPGTPRTFAPLPAAGDR
jgi:aminomethyltransferase